MKLTLRQRCTAYAQLTRLDKPIGSLLLLWPTLWALWIANQGFPSLHLLVVFVIGVFVMRSAGCIINDFADRKLDGAVKRTANRPLPSGTLSEKEAKGLFTVLVLIAFGLVLTLNRFTILLSIIALVVTICYPFMKRITHLPQFVLGIAFSWPIPMAFAASLGHIPPIAWLLFIANYFWIIAYDTMYAMVDRDDDIRIGIKSTAILFGRFDRLWVGIFQLLTLLPLLLLGEIARLGAFYLTGLAAMTALFGYQQYLIRHRVRTGCFRAFLNNNYAGGLLFIGLAIHYLQG
ncbi:4-hydroxybenzoate octaprenyltransferase [Dongshaea marina]|uniref:4-hydroxybenzoate octaprenyltransferase n=1 Tax=Dongshaea marina TaxID=2047966 RepID=UPI000D3E11A1|nr:4-hydroxybenzoate octaprenyltransferase [Dongshaea marina]